jgi:hypothetical protein
MAESDGFSKAAATLSLSFSCLLTAASEACDPGASDMPTLNRRGSALRSLTRMQSPINVAIEQCSTVGVNCTATVPASSLTSMASSDTTLSCSSEYGCSGSVISRICCNAKKKAGNKHVHSPVWRHTPTCYSIFRQGEGRIVALMMRTTQGRHSDVHTYFKYFQRVNGLPRVIIERLWGWRGALQENEQKQAWFVEIRGGYCQKLTDIKELTCSSLLCSPLCVRKRWERD